MILTVTLNAAIDKRYVVDGFQVGQVNRVKECVYVPGGKGLNVSKPAAIAGAEVIATGFVGGHAGAYIEDALKPFGIRSDFYHVEGESRSCINIWDERNQVQTEFLEPGFCIGQEDFENFYRKIQRSGTEGGGGRHVGKRSEGIGRNRLPEAGENLQGSRQTGDP